MSSPPSALPARIDSLGDLQALANAGTRHVLPFNKGQMVWHSWGQGRPLLLLHGGSGSWNHWCRNIAGLVAAGRQLWIPDLPGFGDSTAPEKGQDADALPEPLMAALDQLIGASAGFDIAGFSFGSMVGTFIAEQWPARVARLVILGAPAMGVPGGRQFALRSWLGTPPGPERDRIHRHNLGVLMLADPTAIDELAVRIHDGNLTRDRLKRRRLSSTDIMIRKLATLATPVHAIWGEHDILYRNRLDGLRTALQVARNLQSLDFLPQAGHWLQYERPEALNALLLQRLGQT